MSKNFRVEIHDYNEGFNNEKYDLIYFNTLKEAKDWCFKRSKKYLAFVPTFICKDNEKVEYSIQYYDSSNKSWYHDFSIRNDILQLHPDI